MKLLLITVLSLGVACSLPAADEKPALKDQKEKSSYSIGMNLGNTFKQSGVEIDPDMIATAIKDVLAGKKLLLTEQEAKDAMMAFQTEMRTKQTEKQKALAETNKKDGEKFLAENKAKEGVKTHTVTLPSGTNAELQYKIVAAGTGKKPTTNDMVSTHYRGTLIDGTEFDSSYKKGEPASFPVTQVIKGWTEALLMMPVGSKWQLFIPAELAYGERGRPGIPPNSTLLFDIELLSIPDKAATNAAPKAAAPQPAKTAAPAKTGAAK